MTDAPDPQPPAPEPRFDGFLRWAESTGAGGTWEIERDVARALAARLRQAERKAEYAWKFVGRCEVAEGRVREAEREREELLDFWPSEYDDLLVKVQAWSTRARAAEARVRELEAALPLLRSELDWCIGYAATAEHEAWGERLLKRLHVARALLGSGEEQERQT